MAELTQPILDLTYLIEAADGDTNFIAEILGDYLLEMNKHLEDVERSMKTHDIAMTLRAAHTMKGASANVGANRVRELAAKLEKQAQGGSLEGSASLTSILHQEICRVRELIERKSVTDLIRSTH